MRLIVSFLATALFSVFAPVMRADVITTFTLTHGTDTIQFSLSESMLENVVAPNPGVQMFGFYAPLTINGVTQYPGVPGDNPSEGFEQLQPLGVGAEFYIGYATGIVKGGDTMTYLFEQGPQIYSYINGALVFTPQTIVFPQVYVELYDPNTDSPGTFEPGDTLVITQTDASAVPEPSSLMMLGTGLVCGVGVVRRRLMGR